MSFEYQMYRQEILDFLSSATIKFSPFADQIKWNISNKHGINISSDNSNPYYLNMCGIYSQFDTPMYVTAIETGDKVLFDTNLIVNYPKTFALYRIPSNEYNILCSNYPEQVNLIRSIVYPVKDLATAINAPSLTLMTYDKSILPVTEQDNIVSAITSFFNYMMDRWYVPDFEYENLFPAAFMGAVWNLLPVICFFQRINNLNTAQVHSTHTWEHLQSKGMKDYKAYLSHKQTLFLYRNLLYLDRNKGKAATLEILADNLLNELYVTLVGKNLYQDMAIQEANCVTVPEVISEDINTPVFSNLAEDFSTFESMETMVGRMYKTKLEVDGSMRNVLKTEDTLGTSALNYLPTKFLELKKYIVDTRFLNLMMKVLYQTLCYKVAKGNIGYRVKFVEPELNMTLDLSIGEAIALLNYCHGKLLLEEPIVIPTEFQCYDAYKDVKPDIPFYFYFAREPGKYPFKSIVDIDQMLTDIEWTTQVFVRKEEFNSHVIHQFMTMVSHISDLGTSADLKYHDAMEYLYEHKFLVNAMVDINLVNYTTYEQWFDSSETLSQLMTFLNQSTSAQAQFSNLYFKIMKEILPIDDENLKQFFGANKDDTDYYVAMTNLFTSRSSYNVTFLDTARDALEYLFSDPLCIANIGDKINSCETLPSLTQTIKYSNSEKGTINCLEIGPTQIDIENISELNIDNIDMTLDIWVNDILEGTSILCNTGCVLQYIESDPTKPLSDNNTLKLV